MARSSATAREQARKLQQEQERKQKTQSLLIRVGVVLVVLAVVAGLTFWVIARGGDEVSYTEGPAPAAANEQGGFVLSSSTELAEGEALGTVDAESIEDIDTAETPGEPPTGAGPREEGEPPHLIIYTDAGCPACAQFEAAYHQVLTEWVDAGAITLEYRSIEFVMPYSARAANAFACMAEESPENYMSYLGSVTAERVNVNELTNDELAQRAEQNYGVDLSECISNGDYRAFVNYTTSLASANFTTGTPTIWVDDLFIDDFMNAGEYILDAVQEYQDETGEDLVDEAEEDLDEVDTDADVDQSEADQDDE